MPFSNSSRKRHGQTRSVEDAGLGAKSGGLAPGACSLLRPTELHLVPATHMRAGSTARCRIIHTPRRDENCVHGPAEPMHRRKTRERGLARGPPESTARAAHRRHRCLCAGGGWIIDSIRPPGQPPAPAGWAARVDVFTRPTASSASYLRPDCCLLKVTLSRGGSCSSGGALREKGEKYPHDHPECALRVCGLVASSASTCRRVRKPSLSAALWHLAHAARPPRNDSYLASTLLAA